MQIIKKDEYKKGKLQFGTEVVCSKDGSISCLLGTLPGASTATHVILSVREKTFPELVNSENGKKLLGEIAPI